MRKYYILILITVFTFNKISAQLTEVVSGLNGPQQMEIKDNYLYVPIFVDGKIIKIDLGVSTPEVEDVFTGLYTPTGLAFHGDDLYVSDSNLQKISILDLSVNPPSVFELTNAGGVRGLKVKDDILYVAEYFMGKIYTFDLTQSPLTPTDLFTGVGTVSNIIFHNDVMYWTNPFDGRLLKFNPGASPGPCTVVQNLQGPSGLAIHGDNLYITETQGGKITKVDLTSGAQTCSSLIATDFLTGLDNPFGLAMHGDDLYISEAGSVSYGGKISKINLNSLSSDDFLQEQKIKVFPTVTEDKVYLRGNLENVEKIELVNTSGQILNYKNKWQDLTELDISNRSSGIYFLKIQSTNGNRFVKIIKK